MAKFEFPKNPNADRKNPFEDEQGVNPFGDDAAAPEDPDSQPTAEQNPYTTATSSDVQPYRPGDYETFLPNRGALVWWLGLIGCCIQLLGIVAATLAIRMVGDFIGGMAYGLPGQLIGLAVSVPAVIMGHTDVKAITAGAMEEGGRRATRWGLWFGVVGTLLGTSQLVLYFGLFVYESFYA